MAALTAFAGEKRTSNGPHVAEGQIRALLGQAAPGAGRIKKVLETQAGGGGKAAVAVGDGAALRIARHGAGLDFTCATHASSIEVIAAAGRVGHLGGRRDRRRLRRLGQRRGGLRAGLQR